MNQYKNGEKILTGQVEIPAVVREAADAAYAAILAGESSQTIYYNRRKTKRSVRRAIVIAAAAVMILGTTVFAANNYQGIISLFGQYGREIPETAIPLIQTEVTQKETANLDALVNFSVREVMCDSESIIAVIAAKPADSTKYLLIPTDSEPDFPVSDLSMPGVTEGTVGEYAREQGKAMLSVNAGIYMGKEMLSHSARFASEEDGTMLIMLTCGNIDTAKQLSLTCKTTFFSYDENGVGNFEDIIRNSFDFKVTDNSNEETALFAPETNEKAAGVGLIIEQSQLIRTELGIYTELTYHIAEDATPEQLKLIEEILWFEYLDENDECWESGLSGIGSVEKIDDNTFIQINNFVRSEIPDTIKIRAYDCITNTRYGEVILNRR